MTKEKGLTLISMIISISVMIIISSVVAAYVLKTGLINNAKTTVEEYEQSVRLEENSLLDISAAINKEEGEKTSKKKGSSTDGWKTVEQAVGDGNDENLSKGDFINYSAGDWTLEEINKLKEEGLYIDGNAPTQAFTFGGYTFKGDENKNEETITSRDQSVATTSGINLYSGWRVLSIEEKNGEKRIRLIHAGVPELFYFTKNKSDTYRSEYILSSGERFNEYNKDIQGKILNSRNLDMYIDENIAEGASFITYDEAYNIDGHATATILWKYYSTRGLNYPYLLATTFNDWNMQMVGESGVMHHVSGDVCIGVRPIIDLKTDVVLKETERTKGFEYGEDIYYQTWEIQ
ncbi:MAG: hypothetical protein Q4G05_03360 [Clostridia bacterium]|nr:hypothetical protein [Clostridia bacterium]